MTHLNPPVPNVTRLMRARFAFGAFAVAAAFVLAMVALYATFVGR